jgi:hypothetical protein
MFQYEDLKYFVEKVWDESMRGNNGGMGAPDLFSLYYMLQKLQPKVVVESGVWNGISTKLIRKVLPKSTIICLDPRDVPSNGFIDADRNTLYFTGRNFKDFGALDLSIYDTETILCFFDCHQNAYLRLKQCLEKKIKHVFFNDNYPLNCGSHFTIEHLIWNDRRHYSVSREDREEMIRRIDEYTIFPNIFKGLIKTMEGEFECTSLYDERSSENEDEFLKLFREERAKYRWNTYTKLN